MGIGAATVDRVDSALAADVDEAVARLLASAVAGAQMLFLDDTNRLGALPAVITWPAPEPLLADRCTLFERFGLRVARQQRLNRPQTAALELRDRGVQRALTTMCIGVGQGIAVMLETA